MTSRPLVVTSADDRLAADDPLAGCFSGARREHQRREQRRSEHPVCREGHGVHLFAGGLERVLRAPRLDSAHQPTKVAYRSCFVPTPQRSTRTHASRHAIGTPNTCAWLVARAAPLRPKRRRWRDESGELDPANRVGWLACQGRRPSSPNRGRAANRHYLRRVLLAGPQNAEIDPSRRSSPSRLTLLFALTQTQDPLHAGHFPRRDA
jgi:hypothetical protein